MLFKRLVVPLASLAFASAGVANQCNADNCLRALRATQIATRLNAASTDCSSFLADLTTITYTNTQTFSTTATSISHVTETSTIHATASETLTLTSISTVEVASTLTVLQKRLATTTSTSSLPQYATPCSDVARFKSACSCIGVTSASPRSITVTVSSTLSYSTVLTVTDTTTITTTDSTKTETSSETQTTTVSVLSSATATEWKIQATWTKTGDQKYLVLTSFLNFLMLGFTTDINAASTFRLDGTKLTSGDKHGTMNSSNYGYIFMQPVPPLQGLTSISCSITETRQILCSRGLSNVMVQAGSDPVLALADQLTASNQNLPLIQLTALF